VSGLPSTHILFSLFFKKENKREQAKRGGSSQEHLDLCDEINAAIHILSAPTTALSNKLDGDFDHGRQ
jgi:hypothetical protein